LYLEEVVHDATRAVRHLADARGVRVELGQVVEAPLEGDADLLGRLVLNLLDNAIKYSPHGGLVTVTLVRRGDRYEVSVVDDGVGIPEAMKEKIFERFYRLDAARSRAERTATSGAGLGLAIARRIAEVHGGTLELVSSRPGRTEFRLTLPVASAAVEPEATVPA
jgi:two-component system sensor histidine kinase SenX3